LSCLAFETDDITKLISTPLGELPRQSTIEEHIEKMTLNQSQTGRYLFIYLFYE